DRRLESPVADMAGNEFGLVIAGEQTIVCRSGADEDRFEPGFEKCARTLCVRNRRRRRRTDAKPVADRSGIACAAHVFLRRKLAQARATTPEGGESAARIATAPARQIGKAFRKKCE